MWAKQVNFDILRASLSLRFPERFRGGPIRMVMTDNDGRTIEIPLSRNLRSPTLWVYDSFFHPFERFRSEEVESQGP